MHSNRRDRQLAIHNCSVSSQIGWVRQQDHLDLFLPFTQQSRRDKTVATVISLPAENYDSRGEP